MPGSAGSIWGTPLLAPESGDIAGSVVTTAMRLSRLRDNRGGHPLGVTAPTLRSPVGDSVGRRSGRTALLGRSPALDGLRGLALVWVVVYHFTGVNGPFPGAWIGLDVFFVLSGFLITAMLLDERRVNGRVSLPLFYARRACRLLPALLVMLSVWTAMLLAFHNTTWFAATPGGARTGDPVELGGAFWQLGVTLVYGANWIYALDSGRAPLAHLWSLAVEEQFYIVWPFVLLALLAVLRFRGRLTVVLGLAAVSAALPFLYWDGGAGNDRIYFGTDTRAVGMLLGATAALLWHRRRALGGGPARWSAGRACAGLALLGLFLFTVGNIPVKFLLGPALMGLAAMQVIPHLVDVPTGRLARVFDSRVLVWLGQRSYAVYLWHYLFATWLHPLPDYIYIPVGIALSLVVAQLSWVLVESRVLRWGKRFRPAPPDGRAVDEGRAPAGASTGGHASAEIEGVGAGARRAA
jgi:peptidoglycan/LPS O-acetylase OafA/YrhL